MGTLIFLDFSIVTPVGGTTDAGPGEGPGPNLGVCMKPPPTTGANAPADPVRECAVALDSTDFTPDEGPTVDAGGRYGMGYVICVKDKVSVLVGTPATVDTTGDTRIMDSFIFGFVFTHSFILLGVRTVVASFSGGRGPSSVGLAFLYDFHYSSGRWRVV